VTQAKEFEEFDEEYHDRYAKSLAIMMEDHPWTVMRSAELLKWINSGGYDSIVNNRTNTSPSVKRPKSRITHQSFCSNCGRKNIHNDTYCRKCGHEL